MNVTLTKRGAFTVEPSSRNIGRCGSEALTTFEYVVSIGCSATALNEQDFVLDHNLVQKYFADTFLNETILLSCEMIAMRTLCHFWALMKERQPLHIKVNIIADRVSHEVEWMAKQGPPAMPVPKSKVSRVGETWLAPEKTAAATKAPAA